MHVQFCGIDSQSNVPIVPACVGSHALLVLVPRLAWTAGVVHHLHSVLTWTAGACLGSHVGLVHVHVCGMDCQGNVLIVLACVSSHAVLVLVPHLAWTAGGMHQSRDDPRVWIRTLYL